jgi:preprotein translocase subunit YajC
MKEHRSMVESLSKGDKVVTAGGLLGTISKIEDDRIASVEISENVKVQVVRSTITEVISANNNKKK